MRLLSLSLCVLTFTTPALFAQADDCANATPISGSGSFTYSNVGANTDGPGTTCAFFIFDMGNDLWFSWTATMTSTVQVDTCTSTNYDSMLAVYSGTCGSPQIVCNDDGCGLQSSLDFDAVVGSTYLIRVGGIGGDTGNGTLTITENVTPPVDECTNPSQGTDVIVGDLNGMGNYSGVNGVGAYSIGTTSCNVGTAELLWIDNSNMHPVIAQNIYRHEGNRFEQVGMSWLKHGFGALQQDLCCDCVSSGTFDRLGVGCSDPYTAGLNGNQGGLGARYQVNPFTGAFPWPYDPGVNNSSISKRLQVANDDLDPALHPTATILGEGHYVAPDDAAAGNGFNNASWREISVGAFTNGRWTLSLTGETQRRDPAIRAWPTLDPNAQLTDVMVPNEGLFIVGNTVVDNGDGTWTYEYAVYNLNSHLGAGSFSIPAAPGVNVTNLRFKDVDYHSGEPQLADDWTGVRDTSAVTWSTDSFSNDPFANALNWGTLYNFGFTADAGPTTVMGTLGLFRPNTPDSIGFSVRGPECVDALATEAVRAGSPANPVALLPGQTTRPITGATWDPVIDHTSFYTDATLDVLATSVGNPAPINVGTAFGTLLCNIPDPGLIHFELASTPFSIALPDNCALVGRSVCCQGASLGGSQGLVLTNALDIVLGNL